MCGSASLSCRVGAQTRTFPRRDLVLPKVLQYEPNLRVQALPTVVHRPTRNFNHFGSHEEVVYTPRRGCADTAMQSNLAFPPSMVLATRW